MFSDSIYEKAKDKNAATQLPVYWIWVIVGLTALTFANAIGYDFVNWDDDTYLVKNLAIRDLSWQGIKNLFSTPIGEYNIYRPLIYLGYAIEYALWGLNPKGYHLVSILMHLFNIFLAFRLVKLLTDQINLALFAALFFAVHPMRVESVSWILARVDPQYGLFFLLGLINYVYYLQKSKINYLVYAFLLFSASLLSKPSAVVFPVVLLLVDYFQGRKIDIKMVVEKVPFFLLSLAFGLFTIKVQSGTAGVFEQYFSILDRFFIACYAITFYVYTVLLPINLSILVPLPTKIDNLLPTAYYFTPLILVFLTFLVWYFDKHRKFVIFGLGFFLVNIALVIQIVPYGQVIVADRYTYLSHISLFLLLGYALFEFNKLYPKLRNYVGALVFAFAVVCVGMTFWRNQIWRNSRTLWSDVIDKNPTYYLPYAGRGGYYYERGNYDAALADYKKAVSFKPNNGSVYNNTGLCYYIAKDYKRALENFSVAIQYDTKDAEIFNNLGNAYYMLQDYKEAIKIYDKVLQLNQQHASAYHYRGLCHALSGNKMQACADFQQALSLGNAESARNIESFCK
jgi:tetratricopeptide (TPR) repeat protein